MLETGSSDKEIANTLGFAEGAIGVQLHSVQQRIGVSSYRQLAARLFV
ncbi:hypothetical protein ACFIOY_26620 [Bradyrhizobium sp. TZ2]